MKTALTFDDVLLVPQQSSISTRAEVNLSTTFAGQLLDMPVIAAPMDRVMSPKMANALVANGLIGCMPRTKIPWMLSTLADGINAGVAIGLGEELMNVHKLISYGAKFICVDVANGHMERAQEYIAKLHQEFPVTHIMAGNISTVDAMLRLRDAGASSVRVGIGGGSACTTRIVTGHGVPTWQSVYDIASVHMADQPLIIADGGIRNSGDAVKALAAGADLVMLGKVLAHAEEAPEGQYRGMASAAAQDAWRGHVSHVEGVTVGELPRRPLRDILNEFRWGLESGLSYSGAVNLRELRERAEFVQVTANGVRESQPHGVFG